MTMAKGAGRERGRAGEGEKSRERSSDSGERGHIAHNFSFCKFSRLPPQRRLHTASALILQCWIPVVNIGIPKLPRDTRDTACRKNPYASPHHGVAIHCAVLLRTVIAFVPLFSHLDLVQVAALLCYLCDAASPQERVCDTVCDINPSHVPVLYGPGFSKT